MRSKERLIEVLESIPTERIGLLRDAIIIRLMYTSTPRFNSYLERYINIYTSPHYRELLTEALHYLRKGA